MILNSNSNRAGNLTIRFCLLSFGFILFGGCHFAPEANRWSKELLFGKTQAVLPDRMMVIWTDTVLHQPQQPGVRGFGGRIYFFKGQEDEPIDVDGGLAVYAFDASLSGAKSMKPERKFVFTADQFSEFHSHTDMGPSYSVWVPWDQVGGVSRQLSLVTRFEGRHGGVVISDPAVKLLPGLEEPLGEAHEVSESEVVQASYVDPGATSRVSSRTLMPPRPLDSLQDSENGASLPSELTAGGNSRARGRGVLTIDLPPSFNRHLRTGEAFPPGADSDAGAPSKAARLNADADEIAAKEASAMREQQSQAVRQVRSRYPFRQLPRNSADSASKDTTNPSNAAFNGPTTRRTSPIKAGWIQQLPHSPRSGYPRQ